MHSTQVDMWQKGLKEQGSSLLYAKRGPKSADPSASPERLHSEIGRLKMELDWLKKSLESASRKPQPMGRHRRTTSAD